MKDDIHDENKKVRRQLKAFMAQARKNEEKMRRFNELELQLISADSLADLLRLVVYNYRTAFELDVVSLILVDSEYEVQRMLDDSGLDPGLFPELNFVENAMVLDSLYGISLKPLLGLFQENEHSSLFGDVPLIPASVALLPLVRQGRLIGSLNLGSLNQERFISGSGTEFIERLAAVVSICLENAANHERLKRIGLTDPLTRLNNRRFFEQRLREEVFSASRYKQPLGCMFLDIDKFKFINDSLGHQTGDAVLIAVADVIASCLRAGDVVARYGGEEFVALLPKTGLDSVLEIAERIRTSVSGFDFKLPGSGIPQVSISIGVSMLTTEIMNDDIEAQISPLVARADQALYQAKNNGRDQVVFSKP
ncbi:MAG: sensor domain-containing diguanylate cyclase [Gammaproteobacteria bacterium]|nr:sensor domain-containing diguanylate cyclase [Gammaproteobacteria bacterium]